MAKKSSKLSPLILDEASAWFTEFTAGGLDTVAQTEFNNWLRRSPEHVQAYLQIAAFWEDADLLNAPMRRDLYGLIARARQETNIYPLELAARADVTAEPAPAAALAAFAPSVLVSDTEAVSDTKTRTPSFGVRYRKSFWALAASVTLAVAGAGWLQAQRGLYSTDVGEQRSITLDDGSAIELNARSRLKVRFNESQRSVELLAGQALFKVAKDTTRPFVVRSGDVVVRAIGTQFDVYRKVSGTIVTVVEGKVSVSPASSASDAVAVEVSDTASVPVSDTQSRVRHRSQSKHPAASDTVFLGPGQKVDLTKLQLPQVEPANISVATAWTQKKLVFDGVPLREVVEEFNRYNRRQLVIRDPSLYEFHVSGVFPSTDSARMLDILRRRFGVVLDESGDKIQILAPTNGGAVTDLRRNF